MQQIHINANIINNYQINFMGMPKAEQESCQQSKGEQSEGKIECSSTSSDWSHLLAEFEHEATSVEQHLNRTIDILGKLSSGTYSSDKLVRFTGSLIKFCKNFQLLDEPQRYDIFAVQLLHLRRLLRFNRLVSTAKDSLLFLTLGKATAKKAVFDAGFKGLLMVQDMADVLAYLMQLNVIKQRYLAYLRQAVANLYFVESLIWTMVHIYQYWSGQKKCEKKWAILRYIIDTITSHNELSLRLFTLPIKYNCALSLLSSIINISLVWK